MDLRPAEKKRQCVKSLSVNTRGVGVPPPTTVSAQDAVPPRRCTSDDTMDVTSDDLQLDPMHQGEAMQGSASVGRSSHVGVSLVSGSVALSSKGERFVRLAAGNSALGA